MSSTTPTDSGSTVSPAQSTVSAEPALSNGENSPARRRAPFRLVMLVLAALAIVLSGAVSYMADSNPDGLEAVLQHGCTVNVLEEEQLHGRCPAQHEAEHPLAASPLAEYAVAGKEEFTGLSGLAGAALTLVASLGVFWVLRPRSKSGTSHKLTP